MHLFKKDRVDSVLPWYPRVIRDLFFHLLLVTNVFAINYKPRFTPNPIFTSVLENSEAGTSLIKISDYTVDDEGDTITYSLDVVGQSFCTIDPASGLISLKQPIDREKHDRVEFNVYAEDNFEGGGPTRRATLVFFIYLLDENDCVPQFKSTPYIASVRENASIGDSVLTLSATDKDQGRNAEMLFLFKNGTQIPQFTLTPAGLIQVAGQLDYEAVNRYTLTVVVKDKGQPPLSSETPVIIDVMDVGDTNPVFLPSSSYEVRANENIPLNTEVAKVTAVDGDKGINNAIGYAIQNGNGIFVVDTATGSITVNGTLDREKASLYSLKIKAYEAPSPSSFSIADVIIQLNDLNDHKPTFASDLYYYTIDEDKSVGYALSPVLKATDKDATIRNSAFEYSIIDPTGMFAVDSSNGQLTVIGKLDYETKMNYTFMAVATETLSSEKQNGSSTVVVSLLNINDNSPIFTKSSFTFNVTENCPVGSTVGNVTASDDDVGLFGIISYSIVTSSSSLLFTIDPRLGVISVLRSPDHEATRSETFVVKATDGGGLNAKSSTVIVTIYVTDINDNDPVFTNLPQTVFVPENQPGQKIFTVKATDSDSGRNGVVSYKLETNQYTGFVLDNKTGQINTTQSLDYEGASNTFQLLVTAFDYGVPQRNATQILTVKVKDENDHSPVFNQSRYNTSIKENTKIGSLVTKLAAIDHDAGLNSKLSYSISKGNDRNTFAISSSGEITTQDSIDRETISSYTLLVVVTDQGSPRLSTNSTVFVTVTDENDNYPNFQPLSYSVKVNETAAVGSEVVVLKAVDADAGENARISYSIISGNDQNHFSLNESSGKLIISQTLDWEKTTNYILTVKSNDHGVPSKSRTAFVTIEVLDNNDNSPVFTESKYAFQIYENSAEGRSVGRVTAEDKDGKLPPNRNGIVKYHITSGNDRGIFKIDENIGIITTASGTVDREVASLYNLTITAFDGGLRALQAWCFVTIEILDENDNPPLFSQRNYSARVYENASTGLRVLQVSAVDADAGLNARLAYEISSGNTRNDFSIDADGVVVTSRELDRERTANYTLVVTAKDYGSPQRFSYVPVFITVLDINDNKPVFFHTPYIASALEEQSAGLFIKQIQALDADYGKNALITYSILSSTPFNVFTINRTTGSVYTTGRMDRETVATYNVRIRASDSGDMPQASYIDLIVNVVDINDHVPRILNLPNRTSISEGVSKGTNVFRIDVLDLDAGLNGEVSFSIASGDNETFSVDERTGVVSVRDSLDREVRDSHVLTFNVTDKGTPMLWTSGLLEIAITDVNDNSPMFHPDPSVHAAFYSKSIAEGAASFNAIIMQANATDRDAGENGIVAYSIVSGDANGFISIDSQTGRMKVARLIDRESNLVTKNSAGLGLFSLTVKATDQAESNAKSSTVTVTVIVTDVNDNAPIFAESHYSAGVSEGAKLLTRVATVTATDKDIGQNGRVKYSIIRGNDNDDFAILNPYEGSVTVAKLLNSERTSLYSLTVMASDEGDLAGGVSRNSTTIVAVTVGDLNDNDPIFNQSAYTATVKENMNTRHRVLTVLATDADQGSNGEVWYQITSGNVNQAFEIDNKTGSIYAIASLDAESIAKYTLMVKAEDMGTPSTRKTSVEVVINVEDVNDNPPTLKSSVYVGHVKENAFFGTNMALSPALALEDADQVAISETTLQLTGNGAANFYINSTTLLLTPSKASKLDRENQSVYHLTITAIDKDGLFSRANLIVTIDDVNDNKPTFNQSRYSVTLPESAAIGTVVLNAAARDVDDGSNSVVTYSLRGGDNVLSVNRTTGTIRLSGRLDREKQDHLSVTIVASDQGVPAMESQAQLDIHVMDVIDFKPYFEPQIVEVNVNESTPIHSIVYNVTAKDLDLNDRLSYNLTFVSVIGQFILDAAGGELRLTNSLDREIVSSYWLEIQATDHDMLTSSSNGLSLKINVLDTNDNAPTFVQPFYLNDVVEDTLEGTIIMSVVASDPDQGTNGRIAYSIKEDTHGLLRIQSDTGFISKHGVWQFMSGAFLNFTVIATDAGNPAMHSSVNCSIRWIAINATNPRFNRSSYAVRVREDESVGGTILALTAYTKGRVESITYAMTGGKGKFAIDRVTGLIRIANPLDREDDERFAITITATDAQSLTGVTSVIIIILDVNDNSPVFSSETYMFTVVEDVKAFAPVGSVLATDKDSGENSTLGYSITSGNERSWFTIGTENGTISTRNALDRESQGVVKLTVTAFDHGVPVRRGKNTSVIITLLDVNDNVPRFSASAYNVSVNENIQGDSQVIQLKAMDSDKDRNGSVSYFIDFGNELGYFYIGRTTGSINIAKSLDYESVPSFNLTIRATDDGTPMRLSSTALVRITVIDVNDNIPRFLLASYHFYVQENLPAGHAIGSVKAVDTDATFGRVYYRISDKSAAFSISELNGTIRQTVSLDREVKAVHLLTVEAFNRDEFGNNSLSSSVKVSVQVTDVNDNHPAFPPSCCNANVSESANIGDIVLRVAAVDVDDGANKAISYTIVQGNGQGAFRVDASTGDVRVRAALNHESQSQYELIVNARDQGIPSLSQNATVHIRVLDVNDMKPSFIPVNISAVREDASIGELVATIRAIDNDGGDNGRVSFEIMAGNDDGSFNLDSKTGQLKVAKALDYERVQIYKLRIVARDHGLPSLSSTETFNVNIANINDNIPNFTLGEFNAAVSENMPVGSTVARISAADADNDLIYYYIQDGSTDVFQINEFSGLIITRKILDREITSVYTLTIEATNTRKSANSVTRRRRGNINTNQKLNPTQKVIISIKDVNDNAPKFTQVEYRGGVSENAKYGTNVLQVRALDADTGINSVVVYSIFGHRPNDLFSIDPKTGWIKSAQLLTGKVGQNFAFSVLVKDNGAKEPCFNHTAQVKIFVLTDNQRVVLTMGVAPQLVRDNREEFIRVLQNMTSFIINIEEIQYSKKNGVKDTSSTDLTFYAVDPVTNKVQERDVVIKALEKNEANYKEFFDKWKVKSIKAIEVNKTSSAPQNESTSILIGVAAGLLLLIIPFIFAFCYLRRKQKRKLKAVTSSPKKTDATVELDHIKQLQNIVKGSASTGAPKSDSSYGSNKRFNKTAERFYPIWVEPREESFKPLLVSFHKRRSSASYYSNDDISRTSISNTRTLTTDILMMSSPYMDETDVDNYLESEDFDHVENVSDLFDSMYDESESDDTVLDSIGKKPHGNTKQNPPTREELLLAAAIQPLVTFKRDEQHITAI